MKTPVTLAPEALDFARLIRPDDTVFWAQATAEPVFLTRLLNQQAARCPQFRLFFGRRHAPKDRLGFRCATQLEQDLCLQERIGGERLGLLIVAPEISLRHRVQCSHPLAGLQALLCPAIREEEFQ